jgi:hypothetical protein
MDGDAINQIKIISVSLLNIDATRGLCVIKSLLGCYFIPFFKLSSSIVFFLNPNSTILQISLQFLHQIAHFIFYLLIYDPLLYSYV